jgi:hypothetical protein
VRTLTNTNVLLVEGLHSTWRFDGTWTNLTATTGARVLALNEAGLIGGSLSGEPYLRDPAGRVLRPWTSGGAIGVIGPAGHFAGNWPGLRDLYNAAVGAQSSLATPAPQGRYNVRVRARTVIGVTAPSNEVVIDVP